MLYHIAHLGGQSCQHACAFGHQVTAKHLEHAVELTTTKQATATGAALLDAVAQRRCLLQLLVYLCYLVGHAFVSLLHLVDGLQIRRAHGRLLRVGHAIVLHGQGLDGALVVVHLPLGGFGRRLGSSHHLDKLLHLVAIAGECFLQSTVGLGKTIEGALGFL